MDYLDFTEHVLFRAFLKLFSRLAISLWIVSNSISLWFLCSSTDLFKPTSYTNEHVHILQTYQLLIILILIGTVSFKFLKRIFQLFHLKWYIIIFSGPPHRLSPLILCYCNLGKHYWHPLESLLDGLYSFFCGRS